jgi:DNA-binding IclR family transcriptional regulator
MPEKKKGRTSALGKSLAVMEAIVEHPQPVGLPDLAARLGLPRQTVHRLLVKLESERLVLRDPSRERFSAGPRLSKLAFDTLRSLNHAAPIRAILRGLVEEIGETCNVGVLDGTDYVYLQRIECDMPLRLHLEVGSRMPAHCVSGGQVLLAHLDPHLCQRLLRVRKLERVTRHTLGIADLEARLSKIRASGYALNDQGYMVGIVGAAVPVIGPDSHAVAAVGMQAPLSRLSLKICERHVPRLRRTAEQIAREWFA